MEGAGGTLSGVDFHSSTPSTNTTHRHCSRRDFEEDEEDDDNSSTVSSISTSSRYRVSHLTPATSIVGVSHTVEERGSGHCGSSVFDRSLFNGSHQTQHQLFQHS